MAARQEREERGQSDSDPWDTQHSSGLSAALVSGSYDHAPTEPNVSDTFLIDKNIWAHIFLFCLEWRRVRIIGMCYSYDKLHNHLLLKKRLCKWEIIIIIINITTIIIFKNINSNSINVSGSHWEHYQNIFWDKKLSLFPTFQHFLKQQTLNLKSCFLDKDLYSQHLNLPLVPLTYYWLVLLLLLMSIVGIVDNYRPQQSQYWLRWEQESSLHSALHITTIPRLQKERMGRFFVCLVWSSMVNS